MAETSPTIQAENQVKLARMPALAKLILMGLVSCPSEPKSMQDYFLQTLDYDAIEHILLGDSTGGAHHMPTSINAGSDTIYATPLFEDNEPYSASEVKKASKKAKRKQGGSKAYDNDGALKDR